MRITGELGRELKRLGTHPLRELARLEHEALVGESPATPALLVVGVAVGVWTFVALVVATVFLVSALVVH